MQKVFANSEVPKGTYICLCCGLEQVIEEKGILPPCPECDFLEYKATIIIELTQEELKKKFYECIKLLAISCYLFEKKRINEFLNVMAINLRMLLCDGENSLLPKIIENPLFHKGRFSYEDNVIHPDSLFSLEEKISLNDFLSQVAVRREGSRPVTISKIIRAQANKCGGAHIDTEIGEDFFLASSVSKYYFIVIAKYIIKLAGCDYDAIVNEFINLIK